MRRALELMEWPVRERPGPFMETGGSPKAGLGIDGWVCQECLLSHSAVSPCLLQEARELVEIFFSKAASGTLALRSGNLHIAQPRQMFCLLYLMRCCQTLRWSRTRACRRSGGWEAHLLCETPKPIHFIIQRAVRRGSSYREITVCARLCLSTTSSSIPLAWCYCYQVLNRKELTFWMGS